MGLKIKNQKRFLLMVCAALLVFILLLVSICTLIGTLLGFEVQPANPSTAQTTEETTTNIQDGVEVTQSPDYTSPDSLLVLVNKTHGIDTSYVPADLVQVSTTPLPGSRDTQMRSEAADALIRLFNDASAAGLTLYCASGYRSYETQVETYQENIAIYGQEEGSHLSAEPGYSEHQTGLVMDVTCESMNMDLNESFIDTAEGQWVEANAYRYGFIIRYPKDKTEITGYNYEPWHLRYVGIDAAAAMHESGQCLEEYLGVI